MVSSLLGILLVPERMTRGGNTKVLGKLTCTLRCFRVNMKNCQKPRNFMKGWQKKCVIKVLYMFSSFWLLGVESRDFSQAEEERTAYKAEPIHKTIIIFTQNNNLGPF